VPTSSPQPVEAQASGMTLEDVLKTPNPWRTVLTEWEKQNLADYEKNFGKTLAFNLNQCATKFPVVSKPNAKAFGVDCPTLMTIIHNAGILWYSPADRFLCPQELSFIQGFESQKKYKITTSFAVDLERSRSAFAGQVGNSMCTGVVGAFLCLV